MRKFIFYCFQFITVLIFTFSDFVIVVYCSEYIILLCCLYYFTVLKAKIKPLILGGL